MTLATRAKKSVLIPCILMLLSSVVMAAADVQTMSGGTYADGTHSFARVTIGMDPDSDTLQYWIFWVCDKKTGELVEKARVQRNPRAGSVSPMEASTLDWIVTAKEPLKITVASPNRTPNLNELSGPKQDPNVQDCVKETSV